MRTMVQFTTRSNRQLPEKFNTYQSEIVKREPVDQDVENKHENNFYPVKLEYYSESESELDLDWDEKCNIRGINPENIDISCNVLVLQCNPRVLLERLPESILTKCSRSNDIDLKTENLYTETEAEHIQGEPMGESTAPIVDNNLSRCSRCLKQLKSQLSLRYHLLYCGKLPHLQCIHCDYKTTYKSALKSHAVLKHSAKKITEKNLNYSNKNGLQCKQCSFTTNHKTSLYEHMKNVHFNNLQACCSKCYKKFKYKKALEKHMTYCQVNLDLQSSQCTREVDGENVSTCSKGNENFEYEKSLENHKDHFQGSLENSINKCFDKTSKNGLIKKRTIVKKFASCRKCGKKFKQRRSLNRHSTYCRKKLKLQSKHCPVETNCPSSLLYRASHVDVKQKKYQKEYPNHNKRLKKQSNLKFQPHHSGRLFHSQACPKCGKWFTNQKSMKGHLRFCGKERNLQCDQCSYRTNRKSDLAKHVAIHLEKDVNYVLTCIKCSKTYKNKSTLTKHSRYCGQEPHLQCDHCSYKTKRKRSLRCHILLCHLEKDVNHFLPCSKCGKRYKNQQSLSQHSNDCGKEPNYLQCDYCSHKITTKSTLQRHILAVHLEKDVNHFLPCSTCGKKYKNRACLAQHTSFCGKAPCFPCDRCSYKTNIKSSLKRHIFTVHLKKNVNNILDSLSACSKCNKKFQTRKSLTQHSYYCRQEVRFQCDYCSYKTPVKQSLEKHIVAIHLEKDVNYFLPCSKCGRRYKNRISLTGHLRICGKEPYLQCDHCSYKTNMKSSLKNHVLRAHLEKDVNYLLPCSKCGKRYKNRLSLSQHLNICGKQPYLECDHCSYKTKLKTTLAKHILLIHLEKDVNYCLPCPKCPRKLKNQLSLTRHLYHCGQEPRFKCDHCSYKTCFKSCLKSHILRNHLQKNANNCSSCSKCGKRYKYQQALIRHSYLCGKKLQCNNTHRATCKNKS